MKLFLFPIPYWKYPPENIREQFCPLPIFGIVQNIVNQLPIFIPPLQKEVIVPPLPVTFPPLPVKIPQILFHSQDNQFVTESFMLPSIFQTVVPIVFHNPDIQFPIVSVNHPVPVIPSHNHPQNHLSSEVIQEFVIFTLTFVVNQVKVLLFVLLLVTFTDGTEEFGNTVQLHTVTL